MDRSTEPLRIAYYVSGHGFGHATRVSAIIEAILDLQASIEVTICSTAPSYVFNCLSKGAYYRYAEVDPVIVQPVAYAVDRRASLEVLRSFLETHDEKLVEEARWMSENRIGCVFSDAVFLACAAANLACIPSAMITNFTFDSNWSWLSSDIPNDTPWAIIENHLDHHHLMEGIPDDPSAYDPLRESDLAPLVEKMRQDYSCADALFILPGAIPFPSFSLDTPLPATGWVSHDSKSFEPPIIKTLLNYRGAPDALSLYPVMPYPPSKHVGKRRRRIIPAPLIVRHPTPSAFTPSKRAELLDSCNVPKHLQDPNTTNILIVSFGGQKFKRPSSGTNTPSSSVSRNGSPEGFSETQPPKATPPIPSDLPPLEMPLVSSPLRPKQGSHPRVASASAALPVPRPHPYRSQTYLSPTPSKTNIARRPRQMSAPPKFITPTHIFVPGAPGPVRNPASPIVGAGFGASKSPRTPRVSRAGDGSHFPPTLPEESESDGDGASNIKSSVLFSATREPTVNKPTELPETASEGGKVASEPEPRLLPPGWIAIICGGSSWNEEELLPEDLFIAPRDIYMPDLMVVGDVLLGKLGYGTVSEAIDSGTPFLFVPRPAICEEMGLKLLLAQSGVGLEISREKYESGDWAALVSEAWKMGKSLKEDRRALGELGRERRMQEVRAFSENLVGWVREQQGDRVPNGLEVPHKGIENGDIGVLEQKVPGIKIHP